MTSALPTYTGTIRRTRVEEIHRIENYANRNRERSDRDFFDQDDTYERNRETQQARSRRSETPMLNEFDRLSIGVNNVNRNILITTTTPTLRLARMRTSVPFRKTMLVNLIENVTVIIPAIGQKSKTSGFKEIVHAHPTHMENLVMTIVANIVAVEIMPKN